ncbi:MAG: ATP-binding cassette domain-containing protein [Parachlamydiales bacterium]|nr:ATP-binding cassette domain-containing protein [Parachlamydiales bacterium]
MIEIQDVWKLYEHNEVLQGLSLTIHEGEILVILGRSGVGKSVLLRLIMGLEHPDKGTIRINGTDIGTLKKQDLFKLRENMGMLFQGAALFDSMTIEENIGFYLHQHKDPEHHKKYPPETIHQRVTEALHMVDLDNIEEKMPSDLSGGMKKRAGLARLIAYRPKILLYDEPTTGLDPITAQQINELIIKTQNELQGTSIIVTHDIHSALFIADRIALLDKGKIIHIADTETFLKIDDPIISFLKDVLFHHPRGR